MTTTTRLFVALWPPPSALAACVAIRDACVWSPGARPTPDAHLHVTLRFIGAVPSARVASVAAAIATDGEAFAMDVDRVSVWSNGIAAIEPSTLPVALSRLHATVDAALVDLGFAGEARAFRPHVTLARDARGSTWPARVEPVAWTVDDYALVASRDGRYSIVARYRLEGRAADAVRSSRSSAGAGTAGGTRRP